MFSSTLPPSGLTWGGITLLQLFRALADLYDRCFDTFSKKHNLRWIWNEGRNIEWNSEIDEISKVYKNGRKGQKLSVLQPICRDLYDHSIPPRAHSTKADWAYKLEITRGGILSEKFLGKSGESTLKMRWRRMWWWRCLWLAVSSFV